MNVEELMKISGIGEKKAHNIKAAAEEYLKKKVLENKSEVSENQKKLKG